MSVKSITLVLVTALFYSVNSYADIIIPSHKVLFFEGFFGEHSRYSLLSIVFGAAVVLLVSGYMRRK